MIDNKQETNVDVDLYFGEIFINELYHIRYHEAQLYTYSGTMVFHFEKILIFRHATLYSNRAKEIRSL